MKTEVCDRMMDCVLIYSSVLVLCCINVLDV